MTKESSSSSVSRNNIMPGRILILILVVLLVLIWAYVHFVLESPATVFNRMLDNSLSTSSYTDTIITNSKNQLTKRVISLETGATNRAIESQTIFVPGTSNSLIKVLNIGTPTTDYSKYTQITTNAKNKDGKLINYSSVIGVWGSNSPDGIKQNGGELFSQAALNIVPMANINPTLKQQMLNYLKKYNVYNYSKNIKTQKINGKSVIVYNVKIKSYYLDYYLYQYALAIGLSQGKLQPLGKAPSNDTIQNAQFFIDKLSGQLALIKSPTTGETENYSSYGANLQINIPNKSIKLSKLENNIQSLINI